MEAKISRYLEEQETLLKKHGLVRSLDLDFPMYKELPEELKLALIVINKHKPRIVEVYSEDNKLEKA